MMSDNECDLMPQVFTIDDDIEEFDLNLPPTSGQEYLRRVQLEAKQCPAVVVAEMEDDICKRHSSVKLYTLSGLHPAPKGFAPSLSWQRSQVTNFSQTRQKLVKFKQKVTKPKPAPSQLPLKEDIDGWCKLCFGVLRVPQKLHTSSSIPAAETADEENHGYPPYLSFICRMNQPTVVKVLEYHVNWFEATGFSTHQGRWFYALVASLEKPLEPEACSLLRRLARNCANLRATLDSIADPRLVQLNLLICIVARYFDQLDLADVEDCNT